MGVWPTVLVRIATVSLLRQAGFSDYNPMRSDHVGGKTWWGRERGAYRSLRAMLRHHHSKRARLLYQRPEFARFADEHKRLLALNLKDFPVLR